MNMQINYSLYLCSRKLKCDSVNDMTGTDHGCQGYTPPDTFSGDI